MCSGGPLRKSGLNSVSKFLAKIRKTRVANPIPPCVQRLGQPSLYYYLDYLVMYGTVLYTN